MKRVKKKTPKTFSLTWNYIRIKDEKRIEIMETASLKKNEGKNKNCIHGCETAKEEKLSSAFFHVALCCLV